MSKSAETVRSEDLFVHLERIFSLGGIWPTKPGYVRFTIYIVYFSMHIFMAFADLLDVFGNFELMVMNLVQTIVYIITYTIVWVIRSSKLLTRIITVAKQDIADRKFESIEEDKIYYSYNYVSKVFLKVSTIGVIITSMFWYFTPLMNFSSNADFNVTDSFVLPFRIRFFFTFTNIRGYALVYLYLSPVIYLSLCHIAAICTLVILTFHVCGEMSVLSHRMRNIKVTSERDVDEKIQGFVEMHLKIIWMAKSLDDTFNLVLLDELIGNSVVLGISMYYVLMNLDMAAIGTCCTFACFCFTAFLMLYGYCLVGEQLIQQSITLQNAYYYSDWQAMSHRSRKSLLICMIRSQTLLYLTAGKFYVFSLNAFTDIVKSSLAYVSMLRTLL